jgi:hypothetical protein
VLTPFLDFTYSWCNEDPLNANFLVTPLTSFTSGSTLQLAILSPDFTTDISLDIYKTNVFGVIDSLVATVQSQAPILSSGCKYFSSIFRAIVWLLFNRL